MRLKFKAGPEHSSNSLAQAERINIPKKVTNMYANLPMFLRVKIAMGVPRISLKFLSLGEL